MTSAFFDVGVAYDPVSSPDSFASVEDADAICQAAAVAAGLDRGNPYRAWLSGVTSAGVVSPATRFQQAAVPYVLVDGTPVAANWADLVDGTLLNPIDRDEFGDPVLGEPKFDDVWTGTQADGHASSHRCNEWKGNDPVLKGHTMSTDEGWSQLVTRLNCFVGAEARFFCFEQ